MTLAEFITEVTQALARNGPDADMCFTFVSKGPHGLPVRPELLTEHENGERVYSLSSRQCRKLLVLIDEATP